MTVQDKSKTFNTDLSARSRPSSSRTSRSRSCSARSTARSRAARRHARTIPDRDDEKWMTHTLMRYRGPNADPEPDYSRKVTITKWQPAVRTY